MRPTRRSRGPSAHDLVHFINDPTGLGVVPENVRRRRRAHPNVRVVDARSRSTPRERPTRPVLVVEVSAPGDFSTYTLRLIPTEASTSPRLDRRAARAVDFSFKVNCDTNFDCRTRQCALEPGRACAGLSGAATIRASAGSCSTGWVLLPTGTSETRPTPAWPSSSLAYVGDQLSYRQDAVTTEGYLNTCRLRTSARRHARLVDYLMHDGCNARAWVQVRLEDGTPSFELREASFYRPASPACRRRSCRARGTTSVPSRPARPPFSS